MVWFQEGNVRPLAFKYVVMLLVLCLVAVVSLVRFKNPFGLVFSLA